MSVDRFEKCRHLFPRISYNEVTSEFITDEIREGSFENLQDRIYVNDLIRVEWFATEGIPSGSTGLSAAITSMIDGQIAIKYPEAYDAVRGDCGATTRRERRPAGRIEEYDALERWATVHAKGWSAVERDEDTNAGAALDGIQISERPRFPQNRFPERPYTQVESGFIREEIRRGSFDELEHRRYVNRLVYIEAFTRFPGQVHGGSYPSGRPWYRCSLLPEEFDIIRAELGASTRAELSPVSISYDASTIERREREHRSEWHTVQRRPEK